MEAKHTPGPWAYVEIARTPDGRECGQLIGPASCAALIVEQDGSDAGAANVALAAAAPELLDACRLALDVLAGIFPDPAHADTNGMPVLRAAIARAEGR